MRERLELLVNLWTFGAPVVLLAGALLRLSGRLPARARYLLAIAGFLAVPAAALLAPSLEAKPAAAPLAAQIAEPLGGPLAVAWIAIAALLLVRDGAGHVRLRRSHPGPCTIGLFHPVVVLPADLGERFPADVVERIARHEESHARWRDPLVYAALRVVAAIFWPSPAWLALRWVRREREAAADAAALRGAAGCEERYVEALLRLARPDRALAAGMAASDLEYRARRILAPRGASVLALLVLAGAVFLLSRAAPANLDDPAPSVVRHVRIHVR